MNVKNKLVQIRLVTEFISKWSRKQFFSKRLKFVLKPIFNF